MAKLNRTINRRNEYQEKKPEHHPQIFLKHTLLLILDKTTLVHLPINLNKFNQALRMNL